MKSTILGPDDDVILFDELGTWPSNELKIILSSLR